jgi:predicted nucleic acid-binding protein
METAVFMLSHNRSVVGDQAVRYADSLSRYVDSSVYLRVLLGQPGAMTLEPGVPTFTSAITRLEARRLLFRLHGKGKLTDAELAAHLTSLDAELRNATIVPCDPAILDRAGVALTSPLGALDAIHLASALTAQETSGVPLRLLTHNVELAIAARAAGLLAVTQL